MLRVQQPFSTIDGFSKPFGVNLAGIPGHTLEPVFTITGVILGLLPVLVFRIMKWM